MTPPIVPGSNLDILTHKDSDFSETSIDEANYVCLSVQDPFAKFNSGTFLSYYTYIDDLIIAI